MSKNKDKRSKNNGKGLNNTSTQSQKSATQNDAQNNSSESNNDEVQMASEQKQPKWAKAKKGLRGILGYVKISKVNSLIDEVVKDILKEEEIDATGYDETFKTLIEHTNKLKNDLEQKTKSVAAAVEFNTKINNAINRIKGIYNSLAEGAEEDVKAIIKTSIEPSLLTSVDDVSNSLDTITKALMHNLDKVKSDVRHFEDGIRSNVRKVLTAMDSAYKDDSNSSDKDALMLLSEAIDKLLEQQAKKKEVTAEKPQASSEELTKANETIKQLQKDLQAEKVNVNAKSGEITKLKGSISTLEGQIKEKDNTIAEQNKQIETKNGEIKKLNDEISRLQENEKSLEQERDGLKDENDKLKTRNKELENSEVGQLDAKIKQQEQQIAQLTEDKDAAEYAKGEAEKAKAETDEDLKKANEKISSLNDNLKEERETSKNLRDEKKTLEGEKSDLNKTVDKLNEDINKKDSKIGEQKQDIEKKADEITKLEEDNEAKRLEIEKKDETISTLESEKATLTTEKEAISKQHEEKAAFIIAERDNFAQTMMSLAKSLSEAAGKDFLGCCDDDFEKNRIALQEKVAKPIRALEREMDNIIPSDYASRDELVDVYHALIKSQFDEASGITRIAQWYAYSQVAFMVDEDRDDGLFIRQQEIKDIYSAAVRLLGAVGIEYCLPVLYAERLQENGIYADVTGQRQLNIEFMCPTARSHKDKIDCIDNSQVIIDVVEVGYIDNKGNSKKSQVII